jgi:glycerate-2-kinase
LPSGVRGSAVPTKPEEELVTEAERAYHGALAGADAYRTTRQAVRLDHDVLRIGNRFTSIDKFREIGFVAVGRAAVSQSYAFVDGLGDHLTQGFLAGPDPVPEEIPFQHLRVTSDRVGSPEAEKVTAAALELAGGLGEKDLLLVALSPGSLGLLSTPPPGLGAPAFVGFLEELHRAGATAAEVEGFVRATAGGAAGGRLAAVGRARVVTLLVDRGGSTVSLGGGPTVPLTAEERAAARSVVRARGLSGRLPMELNGPLTTPAAVPERGPGRPVVVASPTDGLLGAGDGLSESSWWSRLAAVRLEGPPAAAATEFYQHVEEILPTVAKSRERRRGIALVAGAPMELVDGAGEGEALEALLTALQRAGRRREMLVTAFRTTGPRPGQGGRSGGIVDATRSGIRPLPAADTGRPGITDVGPVIVALLPEPEKS